ncbi:MAG: HAD-IC family P-type ATPase, partial [Calditrichia bacterium]|nr:HAD-IC family P-type ATPase [Calditrichia bacterium]
MDSFTGLVFLLLIGKLFEKKTYDTLSFDRDYKSYFPVSVTRKTSEGDKVIPLEKLQLKDRIVIRNGELIPADSVMINGEAFIDYSFVTGESSPVKKVSGEIIYAGGKQVGATIEIDVIKEVSQSYLTQLWNDQVFSKKQETRITTLANSISRYFTIAVITIASLSALYWLPTSAALALNALTSVLIVACPCALALSTPFTLGNTLRIFGKNKFYLKRVSVIEALAKVNVIVFDKTGTLTKSSVSKVEFIPLKKNYLLSEQERKLIASLSRQSFHPLSQQIFASLKEEHYQLVKEFEEFPGEGISCIINSKEIKMGSSSFIYNMQNDIDEKFASIVHVEIDKKIIGYFKIQNQYRQGLKENITKLLERFKLVLLTGDNNNEQEVLQTIFNERSILKFNQSPFDKLNFIKQLNRENDKVLMIGDGLNDAGALKQSDVGISVSDDINTFSPASDAILDGQQFHRLNDFLSFSRLSLKIIMVSFGISFLYNFIGLAFAVQGVLSPLIAAILMPISSISVILFTTGTTTYFAKKRGLWAKQ